MVVAIFVLTFGAFSVVTALLLSQRVHRQNEVRTVALSIARQQLEALTAQKSANRPEVTDRAFTISAGVLNQFPSGAEGIAFRGSYSVENIAGTGQQRISVLVRWKNATKLDVSSAPWTQVELSSMQTDPSAGGTP